MTDKSLKEHLAHFGLLTCNSTSTMPNITDLGFDWSDATNLIDKHELFYCKSYKNRTTYLSPEAYYLIKKYKKQKPMNTQAKQIYQLLEQNEMETIELKAFSFMKQTEYKKAFDFLLKERYITAIRNGRILNPNWSTYVYAAAEKWESYTPEPTVGPNSKEQLIALLSVFMTDREIKNFLD